MGGRDVDAERIVRCAHVSADKGIDEAPQAAAIDQDHREDGAGLNGDVEQITAVAQPVLRDQQMTGAGNGQEFGDAFDDAE